MNLKQIISMAFVAIMAMTATNTSAQNLQSASNASRMHANLLARQQRVKDQIKLEETQRFASDLYDEVEPEPDIYAEGWESGLVNPYKDSALRLPSPVWPQPQGRRPSLPDGRHRASRFQWPRAPH